MLTQVCIRDSVKVIAAIEDAAVGVSAQPVQILNDAVAVSYTHLDVYKRQAVFGPKGLAVRQLKWYASWVQNVVRQFGPYLSRAQDI